MEANDLSSFRRNEHIAWYKIAYSTILRVLQQNVVSPRYWFYSVKFFIQRGHRGWADRDTWALNDYLVRWMPDALRYLKTHTRGVPQIMYFEDSEPVPGGRNVGMVDSTGFKDETARIAYEAARERGTES